MNNSWKIACLVIASSIDSIAGVDQVNDGIYRDPKNTEMVAARGNEIEFQVRIGVGNQQQVVNRKYKYELRTGGKIHILASSNDTAFVFGIMKYDWFWNGENIVRKEPGIGETVILTLEKVKK